MLGLLIWKGTTTAWAATPLPDADPTDAEIVVYGDALSPWHDTRWWVAVETIDGQSPLSVGVERDVLRSPAWQVEAMLHCVVTDPKRRGGFVRCDVEAASVRAATWDRARRAKDRAKVETMLGQLSASLRGSSVRLRIRGRGTVTVPTEQPDRTAIAATLLGSAIDAFHLELPEDGWQDGREWTTTAEPLLELYLELGTYGYEKTVHRASAVQGRRIIQSHAVADRTVVTGIVTAVGLHGRPSRDGLQGAIGANARRFLAEADTVDSVGAPASSPSEELTERGRVTLHAVADYDTELGGVRERTWTLKGEGTVTLFRSGRLRQLADDEVVDLGPNMQVGLPGQPSRELPPWTRLRER
ncbi:MAG: hypothetical protein AAF602_05140 [Myxococcota bacterium]